MPSCAESTPTRPGSSHPPASGTCRTPESGTGDRLLGQVLGETYRVESLLGQGGMGSVYRATHLRLGRAVAFKVIQEHLTSDPSTHDRFVREAEIISQLSHPNIVQVLDFNTTEDGRPYLVMDLLDGTPFDSYLETHGALPISLAVTLARQAASALFTAHRQGIVHRDFKPANVFLLNAPDAPYLKLLDFGISKMSADASHSGRRRSLTGQFDILGTPAYMAPEQAAGRSAQVDHRGDQYALAVMTYEMLTGVVPHQADNVMETLRLVITEEALPPSLYNSTLPPEMDRVLLKALAKNPDDRWANIQEFSSALQTATPEEFGGPRTVRTSIAPAEAVQELLERKKTLQKDTVEVLELLESALEMARAHRSPEAQRLVEKLGPELQLLVERRIGPLGTTRIQLPPGAAPAGRLCREQGYVLSHADGITTLEELIDICPFEREKTLCHLLALRQMGLILVS